MINLRNYQQDLFDKTMNKLYVENVRKLCVVLPTGGGKSVLIAHLANQLQGRSLILTHRIEILEQNSLWLKDASILTAKENSLRYDSKTVISMVETAYSRIKKYGIDYLGHFDNIILDEVQVLTFQKVFEKYDYKKLIGFTATPVLNKKKYFTIDNIEYSQDFTLSEIFDDLVQGVDTQDLIDIGYLAQDYNITLELPGFEKLVESDSNPDGYTSQSLTEVYSNTASLKILKKAYYDYCRGKKTLIFNANTKVNKVVFDSLIKSGINVKIFDTVNQKDINPLTEKPYTRKEIIDWFKNEKDAVLINTNVFTTGFDAKDVEVVVVNRATKSLALWIQMVGRGSRISDNFFKSFFTVIDLGQNIYEHGIWSKKRNWKDYFYPSPPRRKHKSDLLDTWECSNCGAYNLTGELDCAYCGEPKENAVVHKNNRRLKDGYLKEYEEIPLPKAKQIIKYCKDNDKDGNFAFQLLERKIQDLFVHYNVSEEFYKKRRQAFINRIMQIYRPIYFGIIKSDLQGANKKLSTQHSRIIKKIDKMYNINGKTIRKYR